MNEGLSCCFRRDQRLVSDGFGPRPDPEKAVEGGMAASTSVEAEADLVPVESQMLVAQAVVGAEGPGLEVGDDAMHPGQDDSVRHRRPVVSRWKIARSICRADPPSMAAQDALAPVKAARSAQIPRDVRLSPCGGTMLGRASQLPTRAGFRTGRDSGRT